MGLFINLRMNYMYSIYIYANPIPSENSQGRYWVRFHDLAIIEVLITSSTRRLKIIVIAFALILI